MGVGLKIVWTKLKGGAEQLLKCWGLVYSGGPFKLNYHLFNLPSITLSLVTTSTMLILQFVLYLSFFVGTLKNEIPGAPLKQRQLKIEQFLPGILKFSTKHGITFWLNTVLKFPALFYFCFMQARVEWVVRIFRTQVIKKKWPIRPVFPDYLFVSYDYDFEYWRYHFARVRKSSGYWYWMLKI